jgi:CheY-like chemotaxis protein
MLPPPDARDELIVEVLQPVEAEPPTTAEVQHADLAVEPALRGAKSEIRPSRSAHVLVVDDDPMHRELVARIVSGVGFEVHTAEDGEKGWEALNRLKYALLITDHEMPKLTGLDLIERLRAVSPDIPCILVSGSQPKPEWMLSEAVRPGAFLSKPFSISELVETIFRLVGNRASGAF